MTATRRATKWALTIVAVVVGAIVALAVGFVVLVAVAVWSFLEPDNRVGFTASEASCDGQSSEALIVMNMAPIDPSDYYFVRVEELTIQGGRLTGVASLPDGSALGALTTEQREGMERDLSDAKDSIDVGEEARVVILRIERADDSKVVVSGMKLWYSHGEPAFVQSIPLRVEWESDCRATLG